MKFHFFPFTITFDVRYRPETSMQIFYREMKKKNTQPVELIFGNIENVIG